MEQTTRRTLRQFKRAALRFKKPLMLMSLHTLGNVLIFTVCPLLIGKTLASIAMPHGDPGHYIPFLIAAAAGGVIANRIGFLALLEHQARTMAYLQQRAVEALLRRSVGFHNNSMGGKLISDAIDYPQGYSQLASGFFNSMIPFVTTLVVGIGIVFTESWVLGLVVVVMTVSTIAAGIWDSLKRTGLRQERLAATKAVTGHIADTVTNVQTVKTFAREDEELHHSTSLSTTLRDLRLNDWKWAGTTGNNRMALLLAMQVGCVVVVVQLISNNPSLLAVGIFTFSFSILLITRLFEINMLIRQIEDGFLAAAPMTDIIEAEPEIQDATDATPLVVTKGVIAIDNLRFVYDDAAHDAAVFDKLNLTIKSGEKIGIVGPSGGGKSTLTRLLLRFEDATAGSISIDGQSIADVTQASLRKSISYVPQEPLLFHRSIRENIAYGKPDASDTTIMTAAKSAYAHEFIVSLPDGYDTIVGERGVKLSGGQRQRIAIARAILKNAPVLILDEATSALDSESEVFIQEGLWKLMQDRTTIVIAHRLSTIQRMDRILVLDNGTICEQGTHKQLLARKNGVYAKLWKHQSGGFIEE